MTKFILNNYYIDDFIRIMISNNYIVITEKFDENNVIVTIKEKENN